MRQVTGTTNGREGAGRHLEAFHRGEHRDRRRDDAVAVEQRRAEQPQHDEQHLGLAQPRPGGARRRPVRSRFVGVDRRCRGPRHQRHQCQHPPLAVVVGAHDEQEVLHRDDQRDRPEDQRQHAIDVGGRRRHAVRQREALLHGVERRRPDVSVDDADRSQRQLHQAGAVDLGTVMMGRGRRGCFGHEVDGFGSHRSRMMNDLHARSEIPVGQQPNRHDAHGRFRTGFGAMNSPRHPADTDSLARVFLLVRAAKRVDTTVKDVGGRAAGLAAP